MAEMQYIKLPDGSYAAFPADLPDEAIQSALAKFKDTGTPQEAQAAPSMADAGLGAAIPFLPPQVSVGVAKGVLGSVSDMAKMALPASVERAVSRMREATGLPPVAEMVAPGNAQQSTGKALETAAELAVPVGGAVKGARAALPSAARAGQKFQEVMGAAKSLPVSTDAAGQVALRISELAERGGSMPMAVRKLLNRITDPEKGALAYEEARDFASNISRLSANEFQRLTPAVAREVANLRVTLNKAIAETASKAGKGKEYASAMNEYAKAMRLRDLVDESIRGLKHAAPYATAAGAGAWLGAKALKLFD